MTLSAPVLLMGIGVSLLLLYQASKIGQRQKGYPPGPPTLPFIGNLHQLPKRRTHEQLQKWADEYGPIYSIILGMRTMIVLSGDTVVKDLLDKRSAIYSSRPDLYIQGTIASGNLRISVMPYNTTWRMLRRCLHSILNIRTASSYVPYQDLESRLMMVSLLDSPELLQDHIRRYTDSLTTQMIFGYRAVSADDPRIAAIHESFSRVVKLASFASGEILDLYPPIRMLPDWLLPIRKYARSLHASEKAFYLGTWLEAKQAIKEGRAKICFATELAKAQEAEGMPDELAAYACGVLHEGGFDTTAATIANFVKALLLHPDVQERGQEEVDRICGDVIPTIDHLDSMPYVRACVKESLRWCPIAPLGIPHSPIQDDEYMGYLIPKGASVVCNVWAINMSPERYELPTHFNPARFLGDLSTASESASNPDGTKRDHFAFGAGRRICPGMHIGERTLFLALSRMLWGFDFRVPDGHTKPEWNAVTPGLIAHPEPYACEVVPRSEKRAGVMRLAWKEVKESLLDPDEQWLRSPEGGKATVSKK
ncbi:cytochrome P450 [Thozetella sp. PMI_491]|nr:cytochrome P450 [Thozetella sp. PMI_491]